MKLKMLGLLGALVFAVPVAAVAAPAGGMTAQSAAPLVTPAVETNAAVDSNGPAAKIDKVWWRGGYGWRGRGFGWRGGWRGYGWRGYGFRGYYGGWGWRRPYWGWRRRWWY